MTLFAIINSPLSRPTYPPTSWRGTLDLLSTTRSWWHPSGFVLPCLDDPMHRIRIQKPIALCGAISMLELDRDVNTSARHPSGSLGSWGWSIRFERAVCAVCTRCRSVVARLSPFCFRGLKGGLYWQDCVGSSIHNSIWVCWNNSRFKVMNIWLLSQELDKAMPWPTPTGKKS
jgi:hypothetical protein